MLPHPAGFARAALLVVIVCSALARTAPARAEEGKGAVRLSGETSFMRYYDNLDSDYEQFEFGLGRSATLAALALMFQVNDFFLFGFKTGFGVVLPDNQDATVYGTLQPRFEFMLFDGFVRPFFAGGAGFAFNSLPPIPGIRGERSTEGIFTAGGSFGVHFFTTRSFTISLSLDLDYARNLAREENDLFVTSSLILAGWM